MAVIELNHKVRRYVGVSTDTKPTADSHGTTTGSTFYEEDTGLLYVTYDGTNWVVKDNTQGPVSLNQIATATTGALANTLAPGVKFRLIRIELKINTAGTTSENFTLNLDAGDGTAYDVNILTQNTKTPAITSLVVPFGKGYEFEADDEIDVAWGNTADETYGLRIVYELL